MRTIIAHSIVAAGLLCAAPALAQAPALYTWTGYGQGQGNCNRYKMTINVTVTGTAVKATFQQEDRQQRFFDATLDGAGSFKTTAKVADGSMKVSGKITPTGGNVVLDGYCKFDAKTLTKK